MRYRLRKSGASFGATACARLAAPGLRSFTLVEMVLAIGVTAFVLISLLGLMSYASQMVAQSDKYSRLAMVSRQMLSTLQSQPFALTKSEAATNIVFYFTATSVPTNSAGAYYQCVVTNATPANFALTNAYEGALMEPVRITILWPKLPGAAPFANTNTIVSSILQYD